MGTIRAIIFDLDGLMINTELLAFQVYQRLLEPFGGTLGDRHFREIIGLDAEATADYVIGATGLPLDRGTLAGEHFRRMTVAMETDLEPNPGLLDLIDALRGRGIPLAIASNSPAEYVVRALMAIRLATAFRVVTGRDEVQQGKPAPDVYLEAARRLGVSPAECLAIEDSPVGMHSAQAAGMRCVIVNERWEDAAFAPANGRYPTLAELHNSVDRVLMN